MAFICNVTVICFDVSMKNKLFIKAFKDTIPVLTGYLVLGLGFGVILQKAGYGVFWSLAMALFIYAGSMQYAGIGLLTGGASFLTIALTTLAVNARHIFYGVSMVGKYEKEHKKGLPLWYLIFGLTDETYSLVCKDPDGVDVEHIGHYYLLVTLLDHTYWVLGCLAGSLAGRLITFNTTGIDFALTALFAVVAADQWIKAEDVDHKDKRWLKAIRKHASAIGGLVISIFCLIIFGKESFLIPSMIFIAVFLLAARNWLDPEPEDEQEVNDCV